MSTDILRMEYHPAMKAVKFQRFQSDSGQEIPLRSDSRLMPYMNRRGKFVLQDHGASFFEDIVRAFDGQSEMEMQVITTKIDYEDFGQMIEYFNKTSECKINATLLAELPSMDVAYSAIREHGIKSMNILRLHQSIFKDVPQRNDSVKAYVDSFLADVQREVDNIQGKISSMEENRVNLCFTGVYSAGKSALINAILGYAILPVDIQSETARMFRIQSPRKDEQVRIAFKIHEDQAMLEWNEKGVFGFIAGPRESAARERIQQTINTNSSNLQHRQMYEILKVLNSDADVETDIKVYFPIPLDNEQVQFTIYDTPGTDSNFGAHQTVLEDALSEQTHSILIFVAAPDKIEGEGNNALLNYLKRAEQTSSKTSIDIGRSLFVVNKADTVDPEARQALQRAEIKDKSDDSFTIKLSNKKLFFTAAKVAYLAKAKRNRIATKKEEGLVKKYTRDIQDEDIGEDERYYLQNCCAMSEYATEKLIKLSADALAQAEAVNDELDMIHVCSGLFALEHEIKVYGEKFAPAVKANAIIDSVEKALSTMKYTANSLKSVTEQKLENLDAEIKELSSTIQEGIEAAYNKEAIPQGMPFPIKYSEKLQIDASSLQEKIIGPAKEFADKTLKMGWWSGKVKAQDKDKETIENHIQSTLDYVMREIIENRSKILKQVQDRFVTSVKSVIENNGKLSEEAKSFLQNIRIKEIPRITVQEWVSSLYDNHRYTSGWWIFKSNYIDKEKFIEDVERVLIGINTKLATGFEQDFRQSLQTTLDQVKAEYQWNIDKYSMSIKARNADKEAMGQLREKIVAVAHDLEICQQELNKIIWRIESEKK